MNLNLEAIRTGKLTGLRLAWPLVEGGVRVDLDGAHRHVHSVIVQMAPPVTECLLSSRAHAPPLLHTGPA